MTTVDLFTFSLGDYPSDMFKLVPLGIPSPPPPTYGTPGPPPTWGPPCFNLFTWEADRWPSTVKVSLLKITYTKFVGIM